MEPITANKTIKVQSRKEILEIAHTHYLANFYIKATTGVNAGKFTHTDIARIPIKRLDLIAGLKENLFLYLDTVDRDDFPNAHIDVQLTTTQEIIIGSVESWGKGI